jgi:hypothetical protein
MTDTRSPAAWLRSVAGLLALAGALVLAGCGGGSGAPSNAFNPLSILNSAGGAAFDVYSGFPSQMFISGGVMPYRTFSSNPSVLPVPDGEVGSPVVLFANTVASDTTVQVTVQDKMGRVVATTVRVHAAPMVNTLTITPNIADCGTNAICSGQTGAATVTLLGPGGGVQAGRQVRFDVVSGSFGIVSTAPGNPIVSTFTVTSDSAGKAIVVLRANTDAPTQVALLRATELASGQQLTASFIIQQITDGSAILSVVPKEATITAAYKGQCTTGFPTDYYIYGGTPPYRVNSTFPNAITIVNSTVLASGSAFTAITNGTCVDPLTFTILDATGRQVTSTLVNKEGSNDAPAVTPALTATITPNTFSNCVAGTHFFASISGGTSPYSVTPSGSPPTVPTITVTGSTADISNLVSPAAPGSRVYNFTATDTSVPPKQATFSITCNNP